MDGASSSRTPNLEHSGEPGNQDGGALDNSNDQEHDRCMPIANIGRVMKRALPASMIAQDAAQDAEKKSCRVAKIAKQAKETVQECVSEFLSFITSEASEICKREKRKIINGQDIIWAMYYSGLENYAEVMKVYLRKYKEIELGEKSCCVNRPPGDQASGQKEAAGPSMSSGIRMGSDGAYRNEMAHMPAMSARFQMGPDGLSGNGRPYMPPVSPRVQIGPGGGEGDGVPYLQPLLMQSDRSQMQKSHQVLAASVNLEWDSFTAARGHQELETFVGDRDNYETETQDVMDILFN